jgi:hypothetical protein
MFPIRVAVPTRYPRPMRTQGGGVEYLPIPRQRQALNRGT